MHSQQNQPRINEKLLLVDNKTKNKVFVTFSMSELSKESIIPFKFVSPQLTTTDVGLGASPSVKFQNIIFQFFGRKKKTPHNKIITDTFQLVYCLRIIFCTFKPLYQFLCFRNVWVDGNRGISNNCQCFSWKLF